MAALREVLARFGIKVDDRELTQANQKLTGFTKNLRAFAGVAAGVFIARGVTRMIDGVRKAGDELDKTSQQIGFTTGQLQEWRFAAGLAGVGATQFSQAVGILQKNTFEAARGSASFVESFKQLGVNFRDSNGDLKDGATLLTEVGLGLNSLDNSTERTAIALTLMGRTGKALLPLFSQGAEGIASARAEFQELGGGFSPEVIQQSVELTDNLARNDTAMQRLRGTLALAVLPTINKFIVFLNKTIPPLIKIVRNSNLIEAGLLVMGTVAAAVAAKMLVAFAGPIAIFAAIAVAIGLVVLVVDDLITLFRGGDSVIGDFIDTLFGIGATSAVVEAVTNEMSAFVDRLKEVVELVKFLLPFVESEFGKDLGVIAQAGVDVFSSGPENETQEQALARNRAANKAKGLTTSKLAPTAAPGVTRTAPGAAGAAGAAQTNNVNQTSNVTVNTTASGEGLAARIKKLRDAGLADALAALTPQGAKP